MTNDIFGRLMKNEEYKKLLEQLPPDERIMVLKSLKEIIERFEKEIYIPLKNHLTK